MDKISKIFKFLSSKENIKSVLEELHPEAVYIYENFMDDNIIEFYANLADDMKEKLVEIIENKINNEH